MLLLILPQLISIYNHDHDDDSTTTTTTTERKQMQIQAQQNHEISCHQLLWGEESTRAFCERHGLGHNSSNRQQEEQKQRGDKNDRTSTTIDLILGSDLIYVPQVIEPLFETVCVLLEQSHNSKKEDNVERTTELESTKRPRTMFIMAHNDRREGSSVTLSDVLAGAKKAGLQIEILQEDSIEGIYIIGFTKPSCQYY